MAAGPYKPNSVRLAAGRPFLWATHYCGALATYPEVLARRAGTRFAVAADLATNGEQSAEQQSISISRCSLLIAALLNPPRRWNSLPIWSCSVWGLPCPYHYWDGGALLPHLFTLTPLRGRYLFCGTLRPPGLNLASRTLSGTLLCGVRTFLPRRPKARKRPSGPAAYLTFILDATRGDEPDACGSSGFRSCLAF